MVLTVIKWITIIGIIAILLIAVVLRFVDFSVSQDEMDHHFSKIDYDPEFKYLNVDGREIYYMTVGDTSKPQVLFVHGSPGSWSDHRLIFTDQELIKKFRFISFDRPGFGNSGKGNPTRSLELQAKVVTEILKKEKTTAIIAGHSYGGPVVVRAAIDEPELIDGIIIIAGSIDPELEETKWYQIPVQYKLLSWILPRDIYATNEEILALKDELVDMSSKWDKITQPVSVIQGGKDVLVPAENANYAQKMLINTNPSMVLIPEMNHFVPWTNPELIKREILRIGETIQQQKSPNE